MLLPLRIDKNGFFRRFFLIYRHVCFKLIMTYDKHIKRMMHVFYDISIDNCVSDAKTVNVYIYVQSLCNVIQSVSNKIYYQLELFLNVCSICSYLIFFFIP
jgi:hypothetical protein